MLSRACVLNVCPNGYNHMLVKDKDILVFCVLCKFPSLQTNLENISFTSFMLMVLDF